MTQALGILDMLGFRKVPCSRCGGATRFPDPYGCCGACAAYERQHALMHGTHPPPGPPPGVQASVQAPPEAPGRRAISLGRQP